MELTIAIVSGLCVAVPSVIATITANKKSSAITDLKIEELTKKVNLHNNLIDRMYKVESRVTVLEDEMKVRK
jgi:hydrogenase maturation factor